MDQHLDALSILAQYPDEGCPCFRLYNVLHTSRPLTDCVCNAPLGPQDRLKIRGTPSDRVGWLLSFLTGWSTCPGNVEVRNVTSAGAARSISRNGPRA